MCIHEAIPPEVAPPYRLRTEHDPEGYSITRKIVTRRGTYQKHGCCDLNLTFWPKDSDYIRSGFLVGESNPAIGLVFDIVNKDTFVAE